jgi:hypothetical protein
MIKIKIYALLAVNQEYIDQNGLKSGQKRVKKAGFDPEKGGSAVSVSPGVWSTFSVAFLPVNCHISELSRPFV